MLKGRLLRDDRAAAAAELALVLPFIAFIFLNVADVGHYIFTKMQVDLAAQEAVGSARVLCVEDDELPALENCAGVETAMEEAAQSTSLDSSVTLGTAEEGWYCANEDGELVEIVTDPLPEDCSDTVNESTAEPGDYIRVTASYTFTPIFPGASVASLLPEVISRTAWLRLQ